MKTFLLTIFYLICCFVVKAQSNIGLSVSTSKSDDHMEKVWYQVQVTEKFSFGVQLRNSRIRYRFVNATAIEEGNTFFAGLTFGLKIADEKKYRLDLNITPSYRHITNKIDAFLPKSTTGLEIDPNIIMSLKLNNKLFYHSGAMLRTTMQFTPEIIGDEQLPSGILLNGISYQVDANTFSIRSYVGPMNGASGDTEKFFWQVSFGYQLNLNFIKSNKIPFINF